MRLLTKPFENIESNLVEVNEKSEKQIAEEKRIREKRAEKRAERRNKK